MNQWNLGADKIIDKKEKLYLANLNLTAGQKAIASTAYPQAFNILKKDCMYWMKKIGTSHYDFVLQITTNAADAAYLSGRL